MEDGDPLMPSIPAWCGTIILLLFLWLMPAAATDQHLTEMPWPSELEAVLQHLVEAADPANELTPEVDQIGPLVDFFLQTPQPDTFYQADGVLGLPSATLKFDLDASLADVLRLSFNPNLPALLTAPSSVRLAEWHDIRSDPEDFSHLWENLASLDTPRRITFKEYEEITPDLFSGAYYAYELDRTLLLFKYQDYTVLLTLSRQRDRSEAGRQGLVLDDPNWQYIYFSNKGLSLPGLGWVKSYIYDSFGLTIYIATGPAPARLRVGMLKGLRAGWSNINMVKNFHIQRGQQRFADALREVLESPYLPKVEAITDALQAINNLTTDTLQARVQTYYQNLKVRNPDDLSATSRRLLDQARQPDHVQNLNRQQLQAVLHLAWLKHALGKEKLDLSALK